MRLWFEKKSGDLTSRSGYVLPGQGLLLGVILLILGLVCNLTVPVEAAPLEAVAPAASPFLYDDTTGHAIISPILRFYNRTGGEARHGKPLSEPIRVNNHYLQYFQRSALEFYPEYTGTGTEVRFTNLGQLAATGANVDLQPIAPFAGADQDWYFPEDGHSLREPFLTYWRNQGDLSGLGLPISEEFNQTAADGTDQVVQYFENVELVRPTTGTDIKDVGLAPLGESQAKQLLTPAQLAPIAKERFTAPRTVKVPSLMFHYARLVDQKLDPLGYNLSIKPDTYIQFLDWVKDNGYNTVTIGQIYDYLQYGILLPDKPVSFRWDDGHDNNWFVYQEMKKRGMTATFYVITKRLELLPAQWQQIDQDGFEVAAHTRTHPDLRAVKDLAGEVAGSKKDLEAMLGHPVRNFAYPYGYYNNTVKQMVRDSGFEIAVTTNGGFTWTSDMKLEEPTISVTGNDTVETFAGKIKLGSGVQAPATTKTMAPLTTTAPAQLGGAVQKTVSPTTNH